MDFSAFTIDHFTAERIDNRVSYPVTWQMYHTARNALVRTCEKHGTTGPMGERPIMGEQSNSYANWHVLNKGDSCVYYIIDDQYNDEELYLYMELPDPGRITREWLPSVAEMLKDFPGWGVGVRVDKGYMLIFENRLLLSGPAFHGCDTPNSVIDAIRRIP